MKRFRFIGENRRVLMLFESMEAVMEIIGARSSRKRYLRYDGDVFAGAASRGLYLLSGCFLLGSLFGVFIGSFSIDGEIPGLITKHITGEFSRVTYLSVLWNISWYHLLAIFLGTSIFGVALLPLLSLLRGYLLSLTVASIIVSVAKNGILLAIIYIGIPSIISLPCFFIISMDSFTLSKKLCLLLNGTYKQAPDLAIIRHAVICGVLLAASALLETYILPLCISFII